MTQPSSPFKLAAVHDLKQAIKRWLPAKSPQEKAARQFFAVRLTSDDVAIDCGANVGKFTAHLARSGATVYAFEPNPHAFKVLEEQFAGADNVHCMAKGVDRENGVTRLFLHENSDQDEVYWSTGSSLLELKKNVKGDKFVDIATVDLCEFIDSLPQRVRLLKMDVEGVECRILKKMIESGTVDKIDHIFVETHDHKIPELKPATDEIRQLIRDRELTHLNLDWT
ncbi:MAG: FkbM family methyltransferase [Cyanobacteria bacterium J06632_22]